ncbi:hypothetical protein SAY86_002398 [Trapa natans]|uniref:Peptidase A1 domain-containing protein n=1 Tax=Trapa natans TaxID=22666 RepID=A0AAN7LJ22_TRANT|nr:hypothetical protein SAY86_002398 [Trapa natans]
MFVDIGYEETMNKLIKIGLRVLWERGTGINMADSSSSVALTIFAVVCAFSAWSLQAAPPGGGFSVELIHRDSPRSPFYDPSESPSLRLQRALTRTTTTLASRMGLTVRTPNSPVAEVTSNGGSYLMNISIGTPSFEIIAIADTGSDLIWTQCKPCTSCYKQVAPLFDPRESSTYSDISCSSSTCTSMSRTSCDGKTCHYSYSYGDQSYTHGNVAVDTVSLASTSGRPVAFPKTLIGCGHDNEGTFNEQTSGIVGLGGGPVSLISQMGKSVEGGFSYCLIPLGSDTASSKLNFGTNAAVGGRGTVSTPYTQDTQGTFYYLTLEGFTIGETRIAYSRPSLAADAASEGNIIIDSGTTLTYLPSDMLSQVSDEVSKLISLDPMSSPPQPFSLCYETTDDIQVPTITVHFTGANVELGPSNTFVKISDNTVCFTFVSSNLELAIYGNIAQSDFLVGYNLVKKTVSFKSVDCTKF